ncbi:MAG: threonine/serine exporter ThrE family protein [Staphylococcus epidermidis]|nr:threonine/serine exporter ThrE family protein [Staphylococcus epidermidis]
MSDSITIIDENKVIDVVLIAGRILLEAGAETYRIEDTMNRIAHSYGLHDTYSFVTSTAIIFSLNDRTSTSLQFSFLTNLIAAFVACGFFLFMFGGVASDAWIACLAGGIAFLTFSFVQKYIQIKFFSEFVASAVVISIAAIFTKLGIAKNQDIITIASVMPLVPGILITNAIRDLLAGELLAGMSRGVEAALTAFAIGAGVAIVLLLL